MLISTAPRVKLKDVVQMESSRSSWEMFVGGVVIPSHNTRGSEMAGFNEDTVARICASEYS